MHILNLAIFAIGVAFMAAPASAQTYDPSHPVCLQVYGPNNYIECSYNSLAQCNASASGRAAQCTLNPFAATALAAARPSRGRRAY